jgi:hypothetical protein
LQFTDESLLILYKWAQDFSWIRWGFELSKLNVAWNIQMSFLWTTDDGKGKRLNSVSPQMKLQTQ